MPARFAFNRVTAGATDARLTAHRLGSVPIRMPPRCESELIGVDWHHSTLQCDAILHHNAAELRAATRLLTT